MRFNVFFLSKFSVQTFVLSEIFGSLRQFSPARQREWQERRDETAAAMVIASPSAAAAAGGVAAARGRGGEGFEVW